jgi:hypothetical protein
VRMWLLIETGDTEAIDVFLSEDDAERALADEEQTGQHVPELVAGDQQRLQFGE